MLFKDSFYIVLFNWGGEFKKINFKKKLSCFDKETNDKKKKL